MVAMANSLLANIVAELEGVSSASKDFSRYGSFGSSVFGRYSLDSDGSDTESRYGKNVTIQ
jgi:hypothetical protein